MANYMQEMYDLLRPEQSAPVSQFNNSYSSMNTANNRATRLVQLRGLQELEMQQREAENRQKLYDPSFWSSILNSTASTTPVATTSSFDDRYSRLMSDPSYIQNTGAYKFRLGEGQKAIERSAAAKGMTGSGNTLAALLNYGQGAAQQAYDTEAQRLLQMRGQDMTLQGQREAANLNARNQFLAQIMGSMLPKAGSY